MKSIQVNKDRGVRPQGTRERQRDFGREGEKHNSERKWCGLILTAGLNQQHLRKFAEGVSQIEQ
jgi:hypothetical protein